MISDKKKFLTTCAMLGSNMENKYKKIIDCLYIEEELVSINTEQVTINSSHEVYDQKETVKILFDRLQQKISNLINMLDEMNIPEEHDYWAALVVCQKNQDILMKQYGFPVEDSF